MRPFTGLLAAACLLLCSQTNGEELALQKIRLPDGFRIDVFASGIKNARQMALGSDGTVYVGSSGDRVYALPDRNEDGRADHVVTLVDGLERPNGVAFRDGALWIAETHRLSRIEQVKVAKGQKPTTVTDDIPDESHHGARVIEFSPQGKLFIGIGAPCNVCTPEHRLLGTISRLELKKDKNDFVVYAHGVRNTVGFGWHPKTKNLWFTDNGRDWLGDDSPPDELNVATKEGQHFGFPFCHGKSIRDPELGKKGKPCDEFQEAAQALGPHVAALGMTFYTGESFPNEYRQDIFIAEHGSWNRAEKIGYRITRVKLAGGKPTRYETFAEGWLQGSKPWGRPVDVLVLKDGSLLVSDDFAHAVYRISYERPKKKS